MFFLAFYLRSKHGWSEHARDHAGLLKQPNIFRWGMFPEEIPA